MTAIVDRSLPQDRVPQPTCCVCYGTGRNPDSDITNWLPCATCHGTGEGSWRLNIERDTKPSPEVMPAI